MKYIVTILFIFAIGFTTEARSTTFPEETSVEESEDILSFVQKVFPNGTPYNKAIKFSQNDVPTLVAALENETDQRYIRNMLVTMGMLGGDLARETLIEFINTQLSQGIGSQTFRNVNTALMSLGYVVNRSGDPEALSFLEEKAQKMIVSNGFGPVDPVAFTLSHTAVLGLLLGGRTESGQVLRQLLSQADTESDKEFFEAILKEHDEIQDQGLLAYYGG